MKTNSTSFFRVKNLGLMLCFFLPVLASSQVLLNQDFNASTVVSTYVGTSTNQFDYIGVSAPSGSNSVYGSNNKMAIQRYSGSGVLAKTTNFSATSPTFLRISFKMSVPFNTVSPTGTQATFYVGSGLFAGAGTTGEITTPANGSRHSQIGVGFGSSGTFYFRNLTTFANSDSLTGENQINWFINKTGASVNYTNLSGGTTALANNTADLWAGNTLILSGIPAITPTQTLDNFKLLFNGTGGGAIVLDDILVTTGTNALPVNISSFKANMQGSANQLTWVTATEINNKGFYVQRQSQNGATWENLGFVTGNNVASTYSFKDNSPLTNSYYRIKQIDLDGKESFSQVINVNQKSKAHILIGPNPASNFVTINLDRISTSTNPMATATLYDLSGKKVLTQNSKGVTFNIDISNLVKGTYLLNIQIENEIFTEKIVKQ